MTDIISRCNAFIGDIIINGGIPEHENEILVAVAKDYESVIGIDVECDMISYNCDAFSVLKDWAERVVFNVALVEDCFYEYIVGYRYNKKIIEINIFDSYLWNDVDRAAETMDHLGERCHWQMPQ